MAAVEEHKPVEKRRALGRGLDSLLPSGPRVVAAAPAAVPAPVVPPPVVIPSSAANPGVVSGSAAPALVPDTASDRAGLETRPYTVPADAHAGESAELHAGTHFSQ